MYSRRIKDFFIPWPNPFLLLERDTLKNFIDQVAIMALDEKEPFPSRVVATGILGYTRFEWVENELEKLLKPNNSPEIQLEAVNALARLNDPESGLILLSREAWSAYTSRVKSAVISAMVARKATMQQLFSAIEDKVVAPVEIPSMIRQRLMNDALLEIKEKAALLYK